MTDFLASLNPAQRQAVEQTDGPLLILAGPGSGKTRVIAHRVAHLISTCRVSPYNILAVTFTNKAARVMKERLSHLAGSSADDMTIGTFHAICARLLRREGRTIGIDPGFVIYDEDDKLSLLKRAIEAVGLDSKQYSARAIASAISAAKSSLLPPQDYLERGQSYFDEVVGRVYGGYQQLLLESNALDFDDLLLRTVQLFRQCPEVLAKYQKRYRHVMVDEFQDTNLTQYELVKMLAAGHRNICVVGDPDQSIYSWRSADLRNILNFEKDYPDAKVVFLEQNYRSTKKILEAAAAVISANRQRKPLNLWTDNDAGEPISVVETYSQQEEAQFIVSEVARLAASGKAALGDCAVMYRTNAQSRALEEVFVQYGMNYRLVAGTRFYERREVKDIIAYLRLILNSADSVSLMRVINVPPRGIGQRSLGNLSAWAGQEGTSLYQALELVAVLEGPKPPLLNLRASKALGVFYSLMAGLVARGRELNLVELFDLVIAKSGYQEYISSGQDGEERWENVLELRTVAQQYSDLEPLDGLTAFLERVALVSDVDSYDESIEAVTLITLHQAKGLEFAVVFITGLEEGLLPHYRSFDDPAQMEEERRLCYVGVTRAKERLYLIRAFRRSLMGGVSACEPSRFLESIPQHLVSRGQPEAGEAGRLPSRDDDSLSVVDIPELKAGDRVRHSQFGEGVVVGYQPVRDDAEVVVDFRWTGVKKLLFSFARLEKVE